MNQQVDNALGGHEPEVPIGPAVNPHEIINSFAAYKPTLRQRFWRWLNFGTALARWDDADGWATGYLTTNTIITIGWGDRLRILVSGKAILAMATRTNVVVDKAESCSAFSVLPPGFKS